MTSSRSAFLSFLVVLLAASSVRAQFSSPAFDPNCYIPDARYPNEVLTYYGAKTEAHLGLGLLKIGPELGDTTDQLVFAGLGSKPKLLTEQPVSRPFFLDETTPHTMNAMPVQPFAVGSSGWTLQSTGHFHCRDRVDLLAENSGSYRIYWADDHGQFDSNRYSSLAHKYWDSLSTGLDSEPYIAYLSSDTVEDLVFGGVLCLRRNSGELDSCFNSATIFLGGEKLYQQQFIAISDSVVLSAPSSDHTDIMNWHSATGDFRGVGRTDLVAISWSGIYYYRNDPPFNLQKFEHALRYDTLMSFADAPTFKRTDVWQSASLSMKTRDTPYDDFLFVIATSDSSDGSIRIFQGGPDFGKQKKYLTSPDVLLYQPGYYDISMRFNGLHYITYMRDCGHMTGSKNRVLFAHASDFQASLHFWYVLGDAIDDKVDMFQYMPAGAASVEMIDANGDGKDDIIMGMPFVTSPNGLPEAGAMRVIYGTSRIPEKKNAVAHVASRSGISLYPNPAKQDLTLSFASAVTGTLHARVQNILGATVFSDQTVAIGQLTLGLHLPPLPSGAYILTVSSDSMPDEALRLLIAR